MEQYINATSFDYFFEEMLEGIAEWKKGMKLGGTYHICNVVVTVQVSLDSVRIFFCVAKSDIFPHSNEYKITNVLPFIHVDTDHPIEKKFVVFRIKMLIDLSFLLHHLLSFTVSLSHPLSFVPPLILISYLPVLLISFRLPLLHPYLLYSFFLFPPLSLSSTCALSHAFLLLCQILSRKI